MVGQSEVPHRRVLGPGSLPSRIRTWGMNALYAAIVVVLFPYALVRFLADHKTRARWLAYAKDLPTRYRRRVPRTSERAAVWVHGVSVGEIKSVAHLVRAIEDGYPHVEVVISVSTDTGRRVAEELYPEHRLEFYPPDLSWIVRDAFQALRPSLIVLVESGFWPTLLGVASDCGVPVVLVNGRLSATSAARYRWGPIMRYTLGTLAEVCVQLEAYAERFLALGVSPDRVHVPGNIKLDNIPQEGSGSQGAGLTELLGPTDEPCVVAGSTHPSEERALGVMKQRLGAEGLPFRLVVAPRHPARAENVAAQLTRLGLSVTRRSRIEPGSPPPAEDVILLDTVGELEAAYALADLVFVGGTLVRHGGQNMMEPASAGRPVVVGPSTTNFRGEVDLLVAADGLVVADDEAGVEDTLRRWLKDPDAARALGDRARRAILAGKGASARTMEVLRPYLDALSEGGSRPRA